MKWPPNVTPPSPLSVASGLRAVDEVAHLATLDTEKKTTVSANLPYQLGLPLF